MLVAMCHDLRDGDGDDNLVLNLTMDPWKSVPVMQIRLSRDFYAKEVLRRCAQVRTSDSGAKNKKVDPRPKQWNLSKILEWLEEHPILDPADISFLKREVASQKEVIEAAQEEEEEENARLGASNWNATTCMRLIHALVDHDEIKAKFLNRSDLPAGRSVVENREQFCTTNVWHLIANKWNDKYSHRKLFRCWRFIRILLCQILFCIMRLPILHQQQQRRLKTSGVQ